MRIDYIPVWITRDIKFGQGYSLFRRKPAAMRLGFWWRHEMTFCPSLFERITGFTLQPGEGPIKVRIRLERVK